MPDECGIVELPYDRLDLKLVAVNSKRALRGGCPLLLSPSKADSATGTAIRTDESGLIRTGRDSLAISLERAQSRETPARSLADSSSPSLHPFG